MPELTDTRRVYGPADFTSLGGSPINLGVLRSAIEALVLTEPTSDVAFVSGSTNRVQVLWDGPGVPTAADLTLVGGVVAAHLGTVTTDQLQQFQSLADTNNATNVYAAKQDSGVDVEWVTLPLAGGAYLLRVSAQVRMNVALTTTGVQAIIRSAVGSTTLQPADDRGYTESSFASSVLDQLYVVSDVVKVLAGQRIRLQPRFRRLGPSGTAIVRNVFLDVLRIPNS